MIYKLEKSVYGPLFLSTLSPLTVLSEDVKAEAVAVIL